MSSQLFRSVQKSFNFRSFSTFNNKFPDTSPIIPPPIVTNNVYNSTLEAVGNTPLIKLQKISALTGCNIYGKAEFANPGGSIKDRAALYIIKDAEEKNILNPNKPGLIIEGTAGNTGIGLTLVGNARGYRTIIVIADTQSKEKKDTLRQCGAELLEVPAVPFKNPMNYVHVAERLAKHMKLDNPNLNILYADQWSNLANRQAHIEGTGPEIWSQLKGKVDAFSCATGTGGTLTGVGIFLKRKNPKVKIVLTDPAGAGLVRYFNEGELKSVGDSISEGIGQSRITGIMAADNFKPDIAMEVLDTEALPILNDLLELEGLAIGSSSAINVAGAYKLAKQMGPGHNIVTILADMGHRYTAKLYNPQFLRSRNLPVPIWLDESKKPKLIDREQLKQNLKKAMTLSA